MPHDKLRDAMRAAGIAPPGELIADGKLHRFDVLGDRLKSKNGWYVFHCDDPPAAAFGSYKLGIAEKWCAKSNRELTKEEKAAYRQRMDAAKKQREEDQAKLEAECQAWCAETWKTAKDATDDHPYLKRKGVKAFGLKVFKDALMVPVRRLTGELVGIQFVQPDGTKKFKTGTTKQGAMHMIGRPKDNTLCIAEGYATAASVHMSTGHACLVAFDAGNLKPVAEAARAKQPAWRLIIAADDDRWTDGNPGINKATDAAMSARAEMVWPVFPDGAEGKPTDFNDLHELAGLDAVRDRLFPPAPPIETETPPHPVESAAAPEYVEDVDDVPPPSAQREEYDHFEDSPFTLLGYNQGTYYYLPHRAPQVVALEASQHSKANLVRLAELQWWQRKFTGSRSGFEVDAAMNALIQTQHVSRGIYDPSRIRGRGAWEDAGRSVLHRGDKLIVDGKAYDIGRLSTKYIYEASIPMEFGVGGVAALTNKEALRLNDLCNLLSWEKPISGTLLAGWCMLSTVCGALAWRPHIHVTGPSGCGKSWIVENIVRPAAGPGALVVQGNTTEAGIRQSLGNDARPLIYDEAEGEDKNAQQRMQSILELARQASSETGGSIYKGSTGGKAMAFRIRSCFCFSSIGVSATQQADQSRISVLGLRNASDGGRRFEESIKPLWKEVMTEDFCRGLRERAIRLIPAIRSNAAIFSEVVAKHLGSKRTGDQIGSLLAGAYALRATGTIDPTAADRFIQDIDWSDHKLDVEQSDERRCLSVILESLIRVPATDKTPAHDKSVAEIIQSLEGELHIDKSDPAQQTLRRHGVLVVPLEGFMIANNHVELSRMLERTPWPCNWGRILARLPGARKLEQIWFSGGSQRATFLPMSYVEGVNY